jgi:hypothetical protein
MSTSLSKNEPEVFHGEYARVRERRRTRDAVEFYP